MFRKYGNIMLFGCMLLLVACASTGNTNGSTGSHGAASSHATVLVVVKPKSVHGSSGNGPIVVTSPMPVPGGNANSQQVIPSDNSIMNQLTFFQLMGAEGDIFTYQYNSSDDFYGTVSAHSSRNGTIQFQIPRAATSNLRLLYRPEVPTETALVSLGV